MDSEEQMGAEIRPRLAEQPSNEGIEDIRPPMNTAGASPL
jgi:hypothetical protein